MGIGNRGLLVVAIAAFSTLIFAGTAWGKCGHAKKGNPSVREYVEQVPTSCGGRPEGHGTRTKSLPSTINRRLQGPDANLLRAIATSEALGAPVTRLRGDARDRSSGNPLFASLGALGGGNNSRLLALLGLMGAIALVVLGLTAYRRRLSRD
jgi:hypothetical protein